MQRKRNKTLFAFLILLFLVFTKDVYSANLNLGPATGAYKVGDSFQVKVLVESPGQSINAISGHISFSTNTLTLSSISKSGSIVNLWAQEPNFSNAYGNATFEGVVLSGYSGGNATVLILNFKAKAVGEAFVKFNTATILANDGQGTNVVKNLNSASFSIAKKDEVKKPVDTPKDVIIDVEIPKEEVVEDEVKPEVAPKEVLRLFGRLGSTMMNIVFILVFIIIIMISLAIREHVHKRKIRSKIKEEKKIVSKAFGILQEDQDEENKIIRKLKNNKPLTEEEEQEIDDFSKNIHKAEKVITDGINDIDNRS